MTKRKIILGEYLEFEKGISVPRDRLSITNNIAYLHYGDIYKIYNHVVDIDKEIDNILKISTDEKYKKTQLLKDGDIVYNLTSESVDDLGKAVYIRNPNNIPFVSGMETTIMRVTDKSILLPEYLNYILSTYKFKCLLRQYVTGMKVYRVHPRDIGRIEIEVPDINEQKKIIDILNPFNGKIELNNQMNQTLEEIANLLYKRWFVDFEFPDDKGNPYKSRGGEMVDSELGMIPKGWEVKKIFEISNVGIGKTPPRKEQGWFLNSKGVNWFSIKDMGNIKSPYIFHSSERLSKRAIDQFNVKIVPKNTVILSFKLTIGRIAITTMDSVTNEAIAQFQILNENVTTEYMYLYFKNLNFMNFGSTSSIATAINSQIIKSIPVIVPIDTINRGFSNILIRYFKMMKENSIESDKLNKIRELLLIELI